MLLINLISHTLIFYRLINKSVQFVKIIADQLVKKLSDLRKIIFNYLFLKIVQPLNIS